MGWGLWIAYVANTCKLFLRHRADDAKLLKLHELSRYDIFTSGYYLSDMKVELKGTQFFLTAVKNNSRITVANLDAPVKSDEDATGKVAMQRSLESIIPISQNVYKRPAGNRKEHPNTFKETAKNLLSRPTWIYAPYMYKSRYSWTNNFTFKDSTPRTMELTLSETKKTQTLFGGEVVEVGFNIDDQTKMVFERSTRTDDNGKTVWGDTLTILLLDQHRFTGFRVWDYFSNAFSRTMTFIFKREDGRVYKQYSPQDVDRIVKSLQQPLEAVYRIHVYEPPQYTNTIPGA